MLVEATGSEWIIEFMDNSDVNWDTAVHATCVEVGDSEGNTHRVKDGLKK